MKTKDLELLAADYYIKTGTIPTVAFFSFEFYPDMGKIGPFSPRRDSISIVMPDRDPFPTIFDPGSELSANFCTIVAAHIRLVDYPALQTQVLIGADDAWIKARIIKRKFLMNKVQGLQKEINKLTQEITDKKGADNGY